MVTIRLDGRRMTDRPSFHRECQAAFGFPDFYGRNMDAWVDCLSTVRDNDGMTAFKLAAGETLRIEILHFDILSKKAPEILAVLEECTAAVNERTTQIGGKPALELVSR
jgi:RNAse (barnase) inhibitor barstar